jgi:hypothetical protein
MKRRFFVVPGAAMLLLFALSVEPAAAQDRMWGGPGFRGMPMGPQFRPMPMHHLAFGMRRFDFDRDDFAFRRFDRDDFRFRRFDRDDFRRFDRDDFRFRRLDRDDFRRFDRDDFRFR